MSPLSFSSENLTTALQRLCAVVDVKAEIPRPGGFFEGVRATVGNDEILQRLEAWVGQIAEVSGWLLTTEALHVYPDASRLPSDIPLHAELYRTSDDTSLNLRHTPQGWIWEELKFPSENSVANAFTEEKTIMIEPDHVLADQHRLARYQVEWRLDSSTVPSVPATFRPTRSRFIGWGQARA